MRRHLAAIRQGVLRGANILFSRIIPLDCTQPAAHPLWRLAEEVSALRFVRAGPWTCATSPPGQLAVNCGMRF